MLFGMKENSAVIDGTAMHYVEFGRGQTPLIILPGLSDGLKTVKGQAMNLAFYFRAFLKDFKVYVFSRKEKMQDAYTTRDMANDLKTALDQLRIEKIFLMGVSQGGMIAQWFAIDYPRMVEKLVIAVSAPRANDILRNAVNTWAEYAKCGDYQSLMIDTLENTYSQQKLKIYRLAYPLVCRIGKPSHFDRFLIQAKAVLTHDAYNELENITCPALIVGGDSDKVVGCEAAKEMAEKIPHKRIVIYHGLGHAAYEEARDFNRLVKDFLLG